MGPLTPREAAHAAFDAAKGGVFRFDQWWSLYLAERLKNPEQGVRESGEVEPVAPSASASPQAILRQAADDIDERATKRDTPGGERSMARCVGAFNALEGTDLTEIQGWRFMICLKLARATAGSFHLDDYRDLSSYGALAGECGSKPIEFESVTLGDHPDD